MSFLVFIIKNKNKKLKLNFKLTCRVSNFQNLKCMSRLVIAVKASGDFLFVGNIKSCKSFLHESCKKIKQNCQF